MEAEEILETLKGLDNNNNNNNRDDATHQTGIDLVSDISQSLLRYISVVRLRLYLAFEAKVITNNSLVPPGEQVSSGHSTFGYVSDLAAALLSFGELVVPGNSRLPSR